MATHMVEINERRQFMEHFDAAWCVAVRAGPPDRAPGVPTQLDDANVVHRAAFCRTRHCRAEAQELRGPLFGEEVVVQMPPVPPDPADRAKGFEPPCGRRVADGEAAGGEARAQSTATRASHRVLATAAIQKQAGVFFWQKRVIGRRQKLPP
jgi:hypothetical protein